MSSKNCFDKIRELLISEWKAGNYGDFIDEETIESIDELIEINELGLLTDNSQQGIIYYGRIPEDRKLYAEAFKKTLGKENFAEYLNKLYEENGGKWKPDEDIIEKERAYLSGYIDITSAYWLSNILNQQSNIIAFYVCLDKHQINHNMYIPITYTIAHFDGCYSPFDTDPLFTLSSIKNIHEDLSDTYYASRIKFPKKYNKDYAYISIIDARYGHHVKEEDGLFKKVIEALKKINATDLDHVPIF
jgi:hypothetical protein